MQIGDKLMSVDGEDVSYMSGREAATFIQGTSERTRLLTFYRLADDRQKETSEKGLPMNTMDTNMDVNISLGSSACKDSKDD